MVLKPEQRIAKDCDRLFKSKGWLVCKLHGNVFQRGLPDRYLHHVEFGPRWVDFKVPRKGRLTRAQIRMWPLFEKVGCGIWILTRPEDYDLLFTDPNWRDFWRPSYDAAVDLTPILRKKQGAKNDTNKTGTENKKGH